jgi:polyphosphate kinase 2 (PPK2 family)
MDAYSDALSKTSCQHAPWHVVPSDRKWYRNLVVAQIIINALRELDMKFPEVIWDKKNVIID